MSRNGTEAIVFRIPECDIHRFELNTPGVDAAYDAKTIHGPWANMCEGCFKTHALYPDLGTGKGQRLVLKA